MPSPYFVKENVICIYFLLPKSYWDEFAEEKKEFFCEWQIWDPRIKIWTYDIIISCIFKN